MRRLPHPMQGGKETGLDFWSHPSLAPNVVAWLQDIPKRTTDPVGESNGTGLIKTREWFPRKYRTE
jgi:hypothetical protein